MLDVSSGSAPSVAVRHVTWHLSVSRDAPSVLADAIDLIPARPKDIIEAILHFHLNSYCYAQALRETRMPGSVNQFVH